MFSALNKKISSSLIALLLLTCVEVIAQDTPDQPPPDPADAPPESGAVPVDGGLALLLATGVGYGAKKAYDYRKSQKEKGKS
jgi:hypothetical protein